VAPLCAFFRSAQLFNYLFIRQLPLFDLFRNLQSKLSSPVKTIIKEIPATIEYEERLFDFNFYCPYSSCFSDTRRRLHWLGIDEYILVFYYPNIYNITPKDQI